MPSIKAVGAIGDKPHSGLIRRVSRIAKASDRTRPTAGGREQYDGNDSTDWADNIAATTK